MMQEIKKRPQSRRGTACRALMGHANSKAPGSKTQATRFFFMGFLWIFYPIEALGSG